MPTIVTRETGVTSKDAPLTNAEVDNNFINLNDAIVDITNNLVLSASEIDAVSSTFTNVGTVEVPIWQINASVLPRVDSLTNLALLNSGGGELCSSSSGDAIVQLNGTPGNGTISYYSPMYPGTYTAAGQGTSALFEPNHPWRSLTSGFVFTIKSTSSDNNVKAGRLTLTGGASYATASGGDLYLTGGTAGSSGTESNGGNINMTTSRGYGTGVAGNILIEAGSSTAVNGEGYVRLRASGTTVIQTGPTPNTLGFYATSPITKPIVSGPITGEGALTSLLTGLSNLGLINITGVTAPTVSGITYNANGTVATVTDGSGTTTFSYDGQNRVSTMVSSLSTLTVNYNGDGTVASVT